MLAKLLLLEKHCLRLRNIKGLKDLLKEREREREKANVPVPFGFPTFQIERFWGFDHT